MSDKAKLGLLGKIFENLTDFLFSFDCKRNILNFILLVRLYHLPRLYDKPFVAARIINRNYLSWNAEEG